MLPSRSNKVFSMRGILGLIVALVAVLPVFAGNPPGTSVVIGTPAQAVQTQIAVEPQIAVAAQPQVVEVPVRVGVSTRVEAEPITIVPRVSVICEPQIEPQVRMQPVPQPVQVQQVPCVDCIPQRTVQVQQAPCVDCVPQTQYVQVQAPGVNVDVGKSDVDVGKTVRRGLFWRARQRREERRSTLGVEI